VLLVLRRRRGNDAAYADEIVPMIRHQVETQVATLLNLNAHARDRGETPFSDADIQMAGYAAALEVLTGFATIDGQDMTRAALRPSADGERGIVEDMIALAVQTATELMVPEGLEESLWQRLNASERFWLKMAEIEGSPAGWRAWKARRLSDFRQGVPLHGLAPAHGGCDAQSGAPQGRR
jgi:putative DNA methylase